jgi:hypothetical protein
VAEPTHLPEAGHLAPRNSSIDSQIALLDSLVQSPVRRKLFEKDPVKYCKSADVFLEPDTIKAWAESVQEALERSSLQGSSGRPGSALSDGQPDLQPDISRDSSYTYATVAAVAAAAVVVLAVVAVVVLLGERRLDQAPEV